MKKVMNAMLAEILEIPARADDYVQQSHSFTLPTQVPYLGMGSSYFAALAFKYMGVNIIPELASEYFHYLYKGKKLPLAVILSQSGKSSEALWCRDLFDRYIAVSNDTSSPLCNSANVDRVIPIAAGEEKYSSSKTYINTLLALFKGFGFDVAPAMDVLKAQFKAYEHKGKLLADAVFDLVKQNPIHGIYITGSGPNIATAYQAALILSESTKLDFHGLPMAQYDHGPKETAKNSIVIQIVAPSKSYARTQKLAATIEAAGAHVFSVEEPEVEEHFSILNNSIPFNFMAYYLSQKLQVGETFLVGGKVTEVNV